MHSNIFPTEGKKICCLKEKPSVDMTVSFNACYCKNDDKILKSNNVAEVLNRYNYLFDFFIFLGERGRGNVVNIIEIGHRFKMERNLLWAWVLYVSFSVPCVHPEHTP